MTLDEGKRWLQGWFHGVKRERLRTELHMKQRHPQTLQESLNTRFPEAFRQFRTAGAFEQATWWGIQLAAAAEGWSVEPAANSNDYSQAEFAPLNFMQVRHAREVMMMHVENVAQNK